MTITSYDLVVKEFPKVETPEIEESELRCVTIYDLNGNAETRLEPIEREKVAHIPKALKYVPPVPEGPDKLTKYHPLPSMKILETAEKIEANAQKARKERIEWIKAEDRKKNGLYEVLRDEQGNYLCKKDDIKFYRKQFKKYIKDAENVSKSAIGFRLHNIFENIRNSKK